MDDQVLESKHVGAESTLKDILQKNCINRLCISKLIFPYKTLFTDEIYDANLP